MTSATLAKQEGDNTTKLTHLLFVWFDAQGQYCSVILPKIGAHKAFRKQYGEVKYKTVKIWLDGYTWRDRNDEVIPA